MHDEPAWDHLLASLNTWADAHEVSGGIEVTFVTPHGGRRVVQLVMTPEDWEELAGVIGIEDELTIRRRVLELNDHERYLVCDAGVELIASSTRELPLDGSTPEHGGQWVATDAAGNVVSRFAGWSDDQR